jgi:hypothetical protein
LARIAQRALRGQCQRGASQQYFPSVHSISAIASIEKAMPTAIVNADFSGYIAIRAFD